MNFVMTNYDKVLCAIAALLVFSAPIVFAESDSLATDTVGGLKIKAIFHHKSGIEEVNSFKIFTQSSGYRIDQRQTPTFSLVGGVSDDKPVLYYITDSLWNSGMKNDDYKDFDVEIFVKKGGKTLRHLKYADCMVTNYLISTLYDGEETFSGKTQFVIADSFDFECRGYAPYSPLYEKTNQKKY